MSDMEKQYDLIIIGGGAAGFSAMVKYSELTKRNSKIAMVSRRPLGGTCVNTGCVPSKSLIETAKLFKLYSKARRKKISYRMESSPKLSEVFKSIESIVLQLRGNKYERLVESYENVDLYIGDAKLVDRNRVRVERSEDPGSLEIYGRNILIATGSRPAIPGIKGLDSVPYYTTDTIWGIDYEPSKILIVGSGAVGLELAQAFVRLGIDVYVVEVLDRPLPNLEPDIAVEALDILSSEGVRFYLKSRISEIDRKADTIEVKVVTPKGIETIAVDTILIATGRKPNSDGLNLDYIGVEIDSKGFIKVAHNLRTTVQNIYAAGDVAGTPKPAFLETLAAREGALAAMNMVDGGDRSIDYRTVPIAIFTDPEIAYVGLTEAQVMEIYKACSCRLVSFSDLPKSSILDEPRGLAKLVIDPYTEKVLGFHVLAPNASEFISIASLAIKHGYSYRDLTDLIQIFPSSSEIIKLSAQAFIRDIGKMPCCVE